MNPDWCCLVLAAGKGTRLLDLTRQVPKPLFPILNTPALDRLIGKLKKEGAGKIAVNCHHLASKIFEWEEKSPFGKYVELLFEETLLDTGGAIKNLFDKLGHQKAVLVYNADIVSNLSLRKFSEFFEKHPKAHALFCLHQEARYNKVACTGRKIISFNKPGEGPLAYTGISAFRPGCFSDAPSGPFPLIPYIQSLIKKGAEILACRAEKLISRREKEWLWHDIGTPEGYLDANFALLHGQGANMLIDEETCIEKGVSIGKNVIIGREARLSGNLYLENVVIWPNTRFHMDGKISNAVITPFGILERTRKLQ